MLDSSLKNDLDALRREELSSEARNVLAKKLYDEAMKIATAQQHRFGSPDGVAGASDLANSRVAAIMTGPDRELGEIDTASELERALYRMLADSWIGRRRKAAAAKRGGGMKRAISTTNSDSDLDYLPAAPTYDELAIGLEEVLGIFLDESEELSIVNGLVAGMTQEEIGNLIGLSRDAVGRRIRNNIAPKLREHYADRLASKGANQL
jgi:hypothetical protein